MKEITNDKITWQEWSTTKKVRIFGVEFSVPVNARCVTVGSFGEVVLWYSVFVTVHHDWWDYENSSEEGEYIGKVNLNGADWQELKFEI
jgi:hypothetical protein